MQDSVSEGKVPEISVLMSVYNGDVFLRLSIESILSQSFSEFECIVVDDASSDTTPQILAEYAAKDTRIRILKNEKNLGLTASLNRGLASCRGKYIARMDADDIALSERLMTQYWFMEEHPTVAACGSAVVVIDEDGKNLGEKNMPTTTEEIKEKMLFNNQFIHSTLFLKSELLKEVGGYDETFKKSQDYELMFRLSSKYSVVNLREKLVQFRFHANSLSWMNTEQQKYAIRARWYAITKYHYSFFVGIGHIVLRGMWLVLPKKIKVMYNKKKMQNILDPI